MKTNIPNWLNLDYVFDNWMPGDVKFNHWWSRLIHVIIFIPWCFVTAAYICILFLITCIGMLVEYVVKDEQ